MSRMIFNGAQIHMLVNHVPVILYPFILLALVWSMWKRENAVYEFACLLALASGIFAIAAYVTGEDAEKVLKQLPDYPRPFVHEHEESAEFGLVGSILVMVLALFALPVTQRFVSVLRAPALQRWIRIALVVMALFISTVYARLAHQGGVIRHTEIRTSN